MLVNKRHSANAAQIGR
jgi:helix-hairpin-helix protein/AAA domain-containing protein